jgi:hypothetical protein
MSARHVSVCVLRKGKNVVCHAKAGVLHDIVLHDNVLHDIARVLHDIAA